MLFSPRLTPGLLWGGLGLLGLTALDLGLIIFIRFNAPSLLTFFALLLLVASIPALLWFGYGVLGLMRARYILSRNALVVDWGWRREVIPMDAITEVRVGARPSGNVAAEEHSDPPDAKLRPRALTWPGYVTGYAAVPELGDVEFLSTTDELKDMALVQYPAGWLALAPADLALFGQAFANLNEAGIEETVTPESLRAGLADWPLWRDRLTVVLLALSAFSVLALVGYLSWAYPQLPNPIALHFDAQGLPNRFGPPTGLFLLPAIGGLAWLVNTVLGLWLRRRESERAGAYLLLGATVLVQGLVWVAAVGLLTAGG